MGRTLILALTLTIGLNCASAQSDQDIQAAVQKALHAYSLTTIESVVRNGSATLTGSVNLCTQRLLAVETAARIPGVKTIEDRIEVSGPVVSDQELKAEIHLIIADQIRKLGGFGVGSMNAHVQHGVVILSGSAAVALVEPAIDAIAGTQGVKNVINHVHRMVPYDADWRSANPPIVGISSSSH